MKEAIEYLQAYERHLKSLGKLIQATTIRAAIKNLQARVANVK